MEEFEVVATLDMDTSEICQNMDGRHFPTNEFIVGTTAPPFHPWCRSTTCPYFDDEFSQDGYRASRGDDDKTVYDVPANMKYPEWKEKFVLRKTENEFQQLLGIITKDGIKINSISQHSVERVLERNIAIADVIDGLTNPLKIGKIKEKDNGISKEYVGEFARTIINPDTGNFITAWKTSTKLKNKLKGKS